MPTEKLTTMEPRTEKNATEATTFNRWRIWDTHDKRWMHLGYDTRATAKAAAHKMNCGTKRYQIKRTPGR